MSGRKVLFISFIYSHFYPFITRKRRGATRARLGVCRPAKIAQELDFGPVFLNPEVKRKRECFTMQMLLAYEEEIQTFAIQVPLREDILWGKIHPYYRSKIFYCVETLLLVQNMRI